MTKRAQRKPAGFIGESEAAAELGIADRTLRFWTKEDWFPADSRRIWKPATGKAFPLYHVERIRAAAPAKGGGDPATREQRGHKLSAETRIAEAKAAQLERQVAMEAGTVVPKAEVELYLYELNTVVRDRIASFPHELASVVPDDLQGRLLAEVPGLVPQKYRPAVQEALRRLAPDNLQTLLVEEGHAKVRHLLREIRARMDEVLEMEV
jgi:hypothetical protein